MSKKSKFECGHSDVMEDPSFEEMRAAMDEQERIIAEKGLTGKVDTFFGFRWSKEAGKLCVRAMWMTKEDGHAAD